ncbi:CopG family transcriptional regulator [Filobacillus milosensis]|uniref:CopG family transcriptional regulator n=1 Tax=Filobacillus milosensis TaxID=94137 RepID=A0A4Y8ITZ5_9BACI|nr:CopG family transcriptional regulator [Filobacillus milosensis]TFB24396.1 CopG family transcriptional regulator [Filobacillus milosensis]
MSKKKLSISLDAEVHKEIELRANRLGIAKSAFVSFATNYFLHQLEANEKLVGSNVNVYELLRNNIEAQKDYK